MLIKEIVDLQEGHININLLMMMDEIIKAGKITNSAQRIELARAACLIQMGDLPSINNFNGAPVTADMIKALKNASDEDVVGLAMFVKSVLQATNAASSHSVMANYNGINTINPSLDPVAWMNYVLHRQD